MESLPLELLAFILEDLGNGAIAALSRTSRHMHIVVEHELYGRFFYLQDALAIGQLSATFEKRPALADHVTSLYSDEDIARQAREVLLPFTCTSDLNDRTCLRMTKDCFPY